MEKTARSTIARPLPFNVAFERDILVSFQYFKVFRTKAHLLPEERLMFAVLTDAIECFQKYDGAKGRREQALFANAESWIMSQDGRGLFSFQNICEALNIEPSYLRAGLLAWRFDNSSNKRRIKPLRAPLRYQYRVKRPQVAI